MATTASEYGAERPVTVSVVVATCLRADPLARCLDGMADQRRPPEEVLVVHRPEDTATTELLGTPRFSGLPLRRVPVTAPGLVAARNAALGSARGEVVAFIDDDAVPRDDWTARIASAFSCDPELAALGGRDLIASEPPSVKAVVGLVQWFGRTIGNHHLGGGPPREVDFLKGCNMSYRRDAVAGLRFDHRLLSDGAQVCEDMAFCLALKRAGGMLRYDPALVVDHFPAPPVDDHRSTSPKNMIDAVHNETLTIFEHLRPLPRAVFVAWGLLIGTRGSPGVMMLPQFIRRHENWPAIFLAALRGRALGLQTALRTARSASREELNQ